MNPLQHALDNLPASHYLHGKPLATLKLNKVVEVALYYQRHNQPALHAAFMAYANGMHLNFDWQWKNRDKGFTLGASHNTQARRFWYEQNQLYAGRGW